jgi:ferredoxin-NADP reductase
MSCNASSAVKIKLLERMEVAHNTMALTFEKPPGFTFKAGQFGDFTLINPKETDQEGNIRGFSLTNPPYADKLMIATRMRDTAFKRTLRDLSLGTELIFDAPYGSFTLHNNAKIPAVFIAGGIGITPVRSIVMQAAKDKLEHDIFLFYANNNPEDAAFLDELMALENDNHHYKFIGIMTKMDESQKKWAGEVSHLSKAMLTRYINDIAGSI